MSIIRETVSKVNDELPKPKARPKPKPLPLRLNKNFENYPLARDVRTAMTWSEDAGRLVALLPREDLIQLILPADASDDLQHAPSGFDMRFVFLLLALVQCAPQVRWVGETKQIYIEASQSGLLRLLDLVVRDQNRKVLQASERYWSMMTIQYNVHGNRGWHEPREERKVKVLPPPIVARKGKIIIMDPVWAEMARDVWTRYLPTPDKFIGAQVPWRQAKLPSGYFTTMPALLPSDAAAQNVVLMTMASIDLTKHESNRSNFANKIGLNSDHRKPRLKRALERAAAWYKEHDGEPKWTKEGAKIKFTKKAPTVPKNPKKGEGL